MEEHGLDNTICSHYMSGFERASQFLRRHIRPCVAVVGMPRRGILVQGRSRIGRAAFSIGLLVALRVIGEGRGERAGADHQRSGGSEGVGRRGNIKGLRNPKAT